MSELSKSQLGLLLKRPLNGLEIQMLNPRAKVLTYTQLYDYKDLDELFSGGCNQIIILYLLIDAKSGHWTTLFKNQNGYNFYDPYGVPPDYELQLLNKEKRKEFNEECDYVLHLLSIGSNDVIFNNISYQRKGTATCGCFVSHRLNHSHLNDEEYFKIFTSSNAKPDDVVVKWCYNKLLKKFNQIGVR